MLDRFRSFGDAPGPVTWDPRRAGRFPRGPRLWLRTTSAGRQGSSPRTPGPAPPPSLSRQPENLTAVAAHTCLLLSLQAFGVLCAAAQRGPHTGNEPTARPLLGEASTAGCRAPGSRAPAQKRLEK